MAGAPLKHERNRLVREAILRGMAEGADPVDFIAPYTDKLRELGATDFFPIPFNVMEVVDAILAHRRLSSAAGSGK